MCAFLGYSAHARGEGLARTIYGARAVAIALDFRKTQRVLLRNPPPPPRTSTPTQVPAYHQQALRPPAVYIAATLGTAQKPNSRQLRRPSARTTRSLDRFTHISVNTPGLRCRLGASPSSGAWGGGEKGLGVVCPQHSTITNNNRRRRPTARTTRGLDRFIRT